MIIHSKDKKASELYHLMTQMIVPRPVAWVLSENEGRDYNLAPFSYFNGVSSDPPIICFSVGKKKNGDRKDTWINIEERKNFVLHIPSVDSADSVTRSADELDYGASEIEKHRVSLKYIEGWELPVLEETNVAMLCRLNKIVEVGNKPQALILGEIRSIFLDDSTVITEGKKVIIDPNKLNPLARLGRSQFAKVSTL